MPRKDLTKLIADNLQKLPHPDGKTRRLMQYNSYGQPDQVKRSMQKTADDVAIGITQLLESNGYIITHKNDPKPAEQPGNKRIKVYCRHCAKQLMTLNAKDDLTVSLSKVALQGALNLKTECPHR